MNAVNRLRRNEGRTSHLRILRLTSIIIAALFGPELFAQGIMLTAAGTEWVFAANGKAASVAPVGDVSAVTLDNAGNLVFADPGNAVVLRVNPDGTITVLAGNGIQGYSGDGGSATHAALNTPGGAAFDAKGNLYIADTGNNRIRMVTPDGIITTFAGNGVAAYQGDNASALSASLSSPLRVAIDASGIIYVDDYGNARIRRITSGNISLWAGNGQAGYNGDGFSATKASLSQVEGMALDANGNLYLAEFASHRVRKIDTNGNISTVAGNGAAGYSGDNGQATNASLNSPGGVALDSANNMYISDTNNFVIRKVDVKGVITTFAGNGKHSFSGDNGPALNGAFRAVFGLVVDSSNSVYVADRDNYRVRKVDASNAISTVAGNGTFRFFANGTLARNAFLYQPYGISFDGKGNLLVADTLNNQVRTVATTGTIATTAGNGGKEYSGDGGPATAAGLYYPISAVSDKSGNIYISDSANNCIRMISGGTITTLAGNCNLPNGGYAGENVPATQALLNSPQQIALDNSGNLYVADDVNNKIRKINLSNDIITTFAGDGRGTYAGDGGPAAKASLSNPTGLAFDSVSGYFYIADAGNARIRRISQDGSLITTVAGGGTRVDTAADSFPATQAALGIPLGVMVDGIGNVYFSDAGTSRVRKVSTSGIMSTVAGNGTAAFTGDGGLSTQASLNFPYGLSMDTSGNLFIADGYNDRIREVLATPPSLQTSPATLSFSGQSGGGLTDPQSVNVSSSFSGLAYKATAATTSGGAWLKLGTADGAAPAALQVTADPSGLNAGTYQGTITIASPNAGVSQTVSVSFTVAQTNPAVLGVGAQTLAFAFTQGGTASLQTLAVTNTGGGTLSFSVSASTPIGNWLSVTPSAGSATSVQSGSVTVQADPTGLDPGTYQGVLSVASAAGSANITVSMTINGLNQKILLSQKGLKFTAVSKGAVPLHQQFAVINTGQGTLNWTATATPLSGGNWLSISPGSGTSSAGDPNPPVIDVSIDPTNLDQGDYYAQIQATSGTAGNSPQTVTCIAHILAPGSDPGPDVQPSGLIFTGVSGSNPSSQDITVSYLAGANAYQSAVVTDDGGGWLKNAPTSASLLPGQPAQVVVYPDFTTLAPGVYHGTITFLFNNNVASTVDVIAVIAGGSGSSALTTANALRPAVAIADSQALPVEAPALRPQSSEGATPVTRPAKADGVRVGSNKGVVLPHRNSYGTAGWPMPQFSNLVLGPLAGGVAATGRAVQQAVQPAGGAGCTPSSTLSVQVTKPQATFTAAVLDWVNLEVLATDSCGSPVVLAPGISVTATAAFSSGGKAYDSQLSLSATGSGTWGATWQPKTATSSPVTITIIVFQNKLAGGTTLTCTLGSKTLTPLFTGVRNAASGETTFVAPGGVVSIYGQQLADTTGTVDGPPFPTELNGTQVLLAGQPLPLHFVGGGQINAQLPYDLSVDAIQQLWVQRGVTLSLPEDIVVAAAQPAVYTQDLSGTGAGSIAHGSDGSLITPSSPAKVGEVVVIYCNGLGPVDPPVEPGTAAPVAGPLSSTTNPVTVIIGNLPATVLFAGLSPGTADLYQVNVTVPNGVPLGDQVGVVVSVLNHSSPTVTMAVH